jgi:hypothetical protein
MAHNVGMAGVFTFNPFYFFVFGYLLTELIFIFIDFLALLGVSTARYRVHHSARLSDAKSVSVCD